MVVVVVVVGVEVVWRWFFVCSGGSLYLQRYLWLCLSCSFLTRNLFLQKKKNHHHQESDSDSDDEEETNRGQASVTLDPSHNDDENITLEETMGHVSFDGTCFCGVLQRWQQ